MMMMRRLNKFVAALAVAAVLATSSELSSRCTAGASSPSPLSSSSSSSRTKAPSLSSSGKSGSSSGGRLGHGRGGTKAPGEEKEKGKVKGKVGGGKQKKRSGGGGDACLKMHQYCNLDADCCVSMFCKYEDEHEHEDEHGTPHSSRKRCVFDDDGTTTPTDLPTDAAPTGPPTLSPSATPSASEFPSATPSDQPSELPSASPSSDPSFSPTPSPSDSPSSKPSAAPSTSAPPSSSPTFSPTICAGRKCFTYDGPSRLSTITAQCIAANATCCGGDRSCDGLVGTICVDDCLPSTCSGVTSCLGAGSGRVFINPGSCNSANSCQGMGGSTVGRASCGADGTDDGGQSACRGASALIIPGSSCNECCECAAVDIIQCDPNGGFYVCPVV